MENIYVRSNSTIVFNMGKQHIIGYGSMQECFEDEKFDSIFKLLKYVSVPKEEKDIMTFMNDNKISKDIFDLCKQKKYITCNRWVIDSDENKADYKNRLYVDCCYDNSQKILSNIRDSILINIGCGGIGNYLIYAYASFLPKKIIMIDGDVVSISNMNRQIFFDGSDVGKLKCDVLKEKLNKRFPSVKYEVYPEFGTLELLRGILEEIEDKKNVIITISGDNNTTVRDSILVAAEYKVPCLNAGYLNDYSVIGPFFIPGYSACPFCTDLGSDYEENGYKELEKFNSFYRAPSSFMNSSMASAMAMTDILHYFSGEMSTINSLNKRIGIGNLDFNIISVEVKKNDKCKVCGQTRP